MFPQSTILDPIFWMVLGAVQVFIFQSAKVWAEDYNFHMNWWKWTGTLVWWFALVLTVAASFTFLAENEGTAGWYVLGYLGMIVVILGAIWFKVLQVLSRKITAAS